jgi:hypothetical protein
MNFKINSGYLIKNVILKNKKFEIMEKKSYEAYENLKIIHIRENI